MPLTVGNNNQFSLALANFQTVMGVKAAPKGVFDGLTQVALQAQGKTPAEINTALLANHMTAAQHTDSGGFLGDIESVGDDIVSGAHAVASVAKSVANTPIVKGALNDIGDIAGAPGLGDTVAADASAAADITGQIQNNYQSAKNTVNNIGKAVNNGDIAGAANAVLNSPLSQVPGVSSLANGVIGAVGTVGNPGPVETALAGTLTHPRSPGVDTDVGFDYATYDNPPPPQKYPAAKMYFADKATWRQYASANVGGLRG